MVACADPGLLTGLKAGWVKSPSASRLSLAPWMVASQAVLESRKATTPREGEPSMELTKGANAQLPESQVTLALSWQGSLDIDVSALLLSASGKVRSDDDFVFYNQPRHHSAAVLHLGKQRGATSRDSISVDLERVEPAVERIVLAASGGEAALGALDSLRLDVVSGVNPHVLFTYCIVATVETAIICGELYRRDGNWKFRAIGQGYDTGLRGVATDYGISVEDDDELVPEVAPPPTPAVIVPVIHATATPVSRVPDVLPRPLPSPPGRAPDVDTDDDEVTLQPFRTDNPYLRRLFAMKEFGRAPGKAIQVFRDRVIDPDEKMLAAFKSQHGRLKWGYLIMTTDYLRWIQTLPLQDEEMFEYTDRIEQVGSMIRVPTGDQFQLRGFGAGRKFKALYQVAQQAHLWQPR